MLQGSFYTLWKHQKTSGFLIFKFSNVFRQDLFLQFIIVFSVFCFCILLQFCNNLPFFKIFSSFVHFCPNFQIFCRFLTFCCPVSKKLRACPFQNRPCHGTYKDTSEKEWVNSLWEEAIQFKKMQDGIGKMELDRPLQDGTLNWKEIFFSMSDIT